jgi:hypothetical protein
MDACRKPVICLIINAKPLPEKPAMRLIRPDAFLTQPWKNGGGVTHEIARADEHGALLWRLSIAEVAADGPFSAFPGLARILTVIEGAGLHLYTPEGRLDALPFVPVAFPGGLAVDSRLIGGPVRDFNLIFDPRRLSASVRPVEGALPACPAAPGRFHALLAVAADLPVGGEMLGEGTLALFEAAPPAAAAGFRGLLARFDRAP